MCFTLIHVTIWKKRSAATYVLSSLFCQYETILTCQLCPVTHMLFVKSCFYLFVLALHAVHQSCLRRGPGAIRYRWGVRKTSSPVGRSSRGPVCNRVWTSTGRSWPRRESRDCEWIPKNTRSLTTQSKRQPYHPAAQDRLPSEAKQGWAGQYLDERPPEKTRLLLEEVLVRPAGGAHPVVCVGPNAPV